MATLMWLYILVVTIYMIVLSAMLFCTMSIVDEEPITVLQYVRRIFANICAALFACFGGRAGRERRDD